MFKRIAIGNDHGGVEAKNLIVGYLTAHGYEVTNMGSDTGEIVRYPYYAAQVCNAVIEGKADGGILICSTGIGMSIMANKFKGIRASLCTTPYLAQMTRRHNNSNVLCLGGKTTPLSEISGIVEEWLRHEYEGGRHDISLRMIAMGEDAMEGVCKWTPPQDISLKEANQGEERA
ncbi:MAG: ribose 5-phosphate isomerase B [Candidatus Pelethousia sp.]|nr:ribose 5-phosphate isomerase B [Candidatus Pelethousia sp.]